MVPPATRNTKRSKLARTVDSLFGFPSKLTPRLSLLSKKPAIEPLLSAGITLASLSSSSSHTGTFISSRFPDRSAEPTSLMVPPGSSSSASLTLTVLPVRSACSCSRIGTPLSLSTLPGTISSAPVRSSLAFTPAVEDDKRTEASSAALPRSVMSPCARFASRIVIFAVPSSWSAFFFTVPAMRRSPSMRALFFFFTVAIA